MDLCPTLDMIGNYFTKALQGSQFHHFRSITIGIQEDEITSYNASVRALIEEKKRKVYKVKKEAQKFAKLSGE